MMKKKRILAIPGSLRKDSFNLKLLTKIEALTSDIYDMKIFNGLAELPHFNPDLDNENPPKEIIEFRNQISDSDGVIISTPEYVFSIPGSLKNAIEWCVSTTVFSHKPVGLITASASGEKGFQELQLIMRTLESNFNDETVLLIKGIKSKINQAGEISDPQVSEAVNKFISSFHKQLASDFI